MLSEGQGVVEVWKGETRRELKIELPFIEARTPHPLFLLFSTLPLLRSSAAGSSLNPTPTLAPIHPLSLLPHVSQPDRAPQVPDNHKLTLAVGGPCEPK